MLFFYFLGHIVGYTSRCRLSLEFITYPLLGIDRVWGSIYCVIGYAHLFCSFVIELDCQQVYFGGALRPPPPTENGFTFTPQCYVERNIFRPSTFSPMG